MVTVMRAPASIEAWPMPTGSVLLTRWWGVAGWRLTLEVLSGGGSGTSAADCGQRHLRSLRPARGVGRHGPRPPPLAVWFGPDTS